MRFCYIASSKGNTVRLQHTTSPAIRTTAPYSLALEDYPSSCVDIYKQRGHPMRWHRLNDRLGSESGFRCSGHCADILDMLLKMCDGLNWGQLTGYITKDQNSILTVSKSQLFSALDSQHRDVYNACGMDHQARKFITNIKCATPKRIRCQ